MQKRIGKDGVKRVRLFVLLVLVLFMAQIFVPLAVTHAQLELEGNETAVDGNGNLTLSVNTSENTTAKALEGDLGDRITFFLGTDENRESLYNASSSATVKVEIYNASQAMSKDFSNESVVFLASLDNETISSINQTINRSVHVIAHELNSSISIGNVDDVNITKYWVYGGDENIENLIIYMDNRFYGNTTAIDPPKPPEGRPKIAFAAAYFYNRLVAN